LARDHAVLVSASGLVTIAGGKWTTYRRMAEDTVDRAAAVGNLVPRPCPTSSLRLDGAGTSNDGDDIPLEWRLLGATRAEVSEYEDRFPGSLHPDLPYSLAMAACAIETEMPVRVEDVLSRRLRALLLDARAAIEAAPAIAALMAKMQGKSAAWAEREVADFRQLARQYCVEGARPHDNAAPRDDNAAPLTAPVPPT
jgi:glycerol-3-phosphate dehydrogenase